MKISVIIPAYNEEKTIGRTVGAVRASGFGDYEIIVIANGCTDRTAEKAKQIADRVINVPERGVSKARNEGAKAAKGEIVVFLDADIVINPQILEKISKIKGNFIATCMGIPDREEFRAKIYTFLKNLCWIFGGANGIIICNKSIFEKVGGFNEKISAGEDSDFTNRARKHAKHKMIWSPVIINMRRYEKLGYASVFWYWVKKRIGIKKEYPLIR